MAQSREYVLQYLKRWRAEHPNYFKEWHAANREYVAVKKRQYRARKLAEAATRRPLAVR